MSRADILGFAFVLLSLPCCKSHSLLLVITELCGILPRDGTVHLQIAAAFWPSSLHSYPHQGSNKRRNYVQPVPIVGNFTVSGAAILLALPKSYSPYQYQHLLTSRGHTLP